MSRIGKLPIPIPKDVALRLEGDRIIVEGPKGVLSLVLPEGILVKNEGGVVTVSLKDIRVSTSLHGSVRAIIANAIKGVTVGWAKTLELTGVGYRAAVAEGNLVMQLGFSHPVTVRPPAGISFQVVEGKIIVSGVDRRAVGQVAAEIRAIKKPEPYKGKGISYQGEKIRKKAGKSAKSIGGAVPVQ